MCQHFRVPWPDPHTQAVPNPNNHHLLNYVGENKITLSV
jgi:hypothetical protein